MPGANDPFVFPTGAVMPGGMAGSRPGFGAGGMLFDPSMFPTPGAVSEGFFGQPVVGSGSERGQIPWNALQPSQAMMPAFGAMVPGFESTIPQGFAGMRGDSRANAFNLYSGIFANDPAGLPGKAAGPMYGTAANITMAQAIEQQRRNMLAEQQAMSALGGMMFNPAVQGTNALSLSLLQNPLMTSSDALQGDIEGMLRRRYANAAGGALGSLGAAQGAQGLLGGESDLLRAGVDFGSRADLADALAESRINQALRRSQDYQTTMGLFGGAGQNLTSMYLNPALTAAQTTAGAVANPYTDSLVEQLRAMGGMSIEDEYFQALKSEAQRGALIGAGTGLVSAILS